VRQISLKVSADFECRSVAVDLVFALVKQVDRADLAFCNEMVTAFGESFNNILAHGYQARSGGVIDVEAEILGDRIVLRIIDSGRAVNFNEVEPPDLDALPESGMGVFMIHALVDEVRYHAGPPNVLTLVKQMPPGSR
jgi:serine/threonine-protein kinase RsbW